MPASRASGVYDGDLDLHVQSPDDLVAQLAKVEYEAETGFTETNPSSNHRDWHRRSLQEFSIPAEATGGAAMTVTYSTEHRPPARAAKPGCRRDIPTQPEFEVHLVCKLQD